MITMKDISVIFKSRFPVSPVYINALVLFNGKLLPAFVNHITSLFAYCKGGNFNIHIWAWFGYFIC